MFVFQKPVGSERGDYGDPRPRISRTAQGIEPWAVLVFFACRIWCPVLVGAGALLAQGEKGSSR